MYGSHHNYTGHGGRVDQYQRSSVGLGPNVWDDELEILFDVNTASAQVGAPTNTNNGMGTTTIYELGSPPDTPASGVDLSSLSSSSHINRHQNNYSSSAGMQRPQDGSDGDGQSVKNEEEGSGGGSVAGVGAKGKGRKVVDKKAKRRAAVAAASRATRAKRKRELEDLRETNQRLEKERERFLGQIAELQMKVQALRETGSIDLRMENDLLRAELGEHKQFISQFKRIADGIPTTKSAKRVMSKQGADTALAQVLGLASTSSIDSSWQPGCIPGYPFISLRFQRLPYGTTAHECKRTSVRFDVPFIPIPPERLAQIIWRILVEADYLKRMNKHYGVADISIKEIDTGLNDGVFTDKPKVGDKGDLIKLYYLRETRPCATGVKGNGTASGDSIDKAIASASGGSQGIQGPRITVDTVQVCTRKQCSVSASSFLYNMDGSAIAGPNGVGNKNGSPGVMMTSSSSLASSANPFASLTSGSMEAIVIASTTTQHAAELEPEKPGVHRIRSSVLEGSIIRAVPGGCQWTNIHSCPTQEYEHEMMRVIIDDENHLTQTWASRVDEAHAICVSECTEEEVRQYQAASGTPAATVERWLEMAKQAKLSQGSL